MKNLILDQGITELMAVTCRTNRIKFRNHLLEPLEDGKVYSLAAHLRQRYLAALPARESGLESGVELATQSGDPVGDPVRRPSLPSFEGAAKR